MSAPIYEELANQHGIRVPERPTPWPRNRKETDMTDPTEDEQVPDTGDLIDPEADDPTGEEITDPEHPDYVEPHPGARPVEPLDGDEENG